MADESLYEEFERDVDHEQQALFDSGPSWVDLWKGMPEYPQLDLTPRQTIEVCFRTDDDRASFAALVGQRITEKTPSIWFPKANLPPLADKRFTSRAAVIPLYPVYVISKGRWESRLTVRALDEIGVPYTVVVEPQEREQYAAVIDPSRIVVTPFSNLGQGSIPARNFVWEHAVARGAARHWILDDNIRGFVRRYHNRNVPVVTGAVFRAAEDFVDRFENVAIAGFNYRFLGGDQRALQPPFLLNTRVYSCILLKNDLPHRWRGRYNEDTDLSIRVLKDGWCTILFNAFKAEKIATMTMKGGNTDELYRDDGRLRMAESLREQHPDCVVVSEKWGRPQHHVDYARFKANRLRPRFGARFDDEVNNFGMELEVVKDA